MFCLYVRGDKMRVLNSDTLEKVAQYNIDYQIEKGRTPSFREIMQALKFGGINSNSQFSKSSGN